MVPAEYSEAFDCLVPGWTTEIIQNCGHYSGYYSKEEQPVEFLESVMGFFKSPSTVNTLRGWRLP